MSITIIKTKQNAATRNRSDAALPSPGQRKKIKIKVKKGQGAKYIVFLKFVILNYTPI